MKKTLILTAIIAMASPACALHASKKPPARDLNLITHEQLAANQFRTAWDAVLSLHSNWLQGRAVSSSSNRVLVYLDNVRLGGIEALQSINIRTVRFIRYHDGLAATTRWGIDHGAGVIYVSTHLENRPAERPG